MTPGETRNISITVDAPSSASGNTYDENTTLSYDVLNSEGTVVESKQTTDSVTITVN